MAKETCRPLNSGRTLSPLMGSTGKRSHDEDYTVAQRRIFLPRGMVDPPRGGHDGHDPGLCLRHSLCRAGRSRRGEPHPLPVGGSAADTVERGSGLTVEEESMARQGKTLTRLAISLLVGCALPAMSAFAQRTKPGATAPDSNADSAAAMKALTEHQGIWKWVVPPVKMRGAFDDHDPIGLVAGKLIPADCSINWTDPDTHQLYCFTTATSLVYFLDSTQNLLAEAEKNWRALKREPGKAR